MYVLCSIMYVLRSEYVRMKLVGTANIKTHANSVVVNRWLVPWAGVHPRNDGVGTQLEIGVFHALTDGVDSGEKRGGSDAWHLHSGETR